MSKTGGGVGTNQHQIKGTSQAKGKATTCAASVDSLDSTPTKRPFADMIYWMPIGMVCYPLVRLYRDSADIPYCANNGDAWTPSSIDNSDKFKLVEQAEDFLINNRDQIDEYKRLTGTTENSDQEVINAYIASRGVPSRDHWDQTDPELAAQLHHTARLEETISLETTEHDHSDYRGTDATKPRLRINWETPWDTE